MSKLEMAQKAIADAQKLMDETTNMGIDDCAEFTPEIILMKAQEV
jgi:hypothetical protein